MRIVIAIPSFYPGWGGAENQARRQAAELVRRGHEVTAVTWKRDPALPDTDAVDGITIRRVPRAPGPLGAARGFLAMIRLLCRLGSNADLFFAPYLLSTAYLAQVAAAVTRVPLVLLPVSTGRCPDSDIWRLAHPGLSGCLRRLVLRPVMRRGVVIALSWEIAAQLRDIGFRRVVRIPNGIVDTGTPPRRTLRARLYGPLGIGPSDRVVTAIGRFDPLKGFDILLDAWARVPGDAHLVLVGSGDEEAALRARIARLGLQRVHFARSTPEEAPYWPAAADLVVLPSRYEGLSNVLLEAMAAGVAVVSAAVSGSTDFIQDGVTGRLVPREDPAAMAGAIAAVLDRPGTMGREARSLVLAQCEMSHVIDLYEEVFARLDSLPPCMTDGETLLGDERKESNVCVESAG